MKTIPLPISLPASLPASSVLASSFLVSAVSVLWLCGASALRAEPVGDFAIVDVNTTSPRHDEVVSPRDYLHQVSGYYFGDPG